jgi:succinylglutamate desuccinylase
VTALVHGNELCGAVALDWLLRLNLRPHQGKLSLVFVNVAAFEQFDPLVPDGSRWVDEDFNRLWGEGVLSDPVRPVTQEVLRARQLLPWLSTVDLLLDLHSMQHKTEALTIAGPTDKGRQLACDIGWPAIVVSDKGHAEGVRMRDFGDFANPASPRNAALVECGQHWETESIEVAKDCVTGFLRHTGVVPVDFAQERMAKRPSRLPQRVYQVSGPVTIKTDSFRFAQDWRGFEHLAKGSLIGHDGDEAVLAPHEPTVLIMPTRRLWPGKTAVRLAFPVP